MLSGQNVGIRLFGRGLTNQTKIRLTTVTKEFGQDCKSDTEHRQSETFPVQGNEDGTMATVDIPGEAMSSAFTDDGESLPYYLCLKSPDQPGFVHQGNDTESSLFLRVYDHPLPIWLMICAIVVLLCLSGLFSGLNLGLMALDQTELEIVKNTGSEKERVYANKIAPIRSHGNFLLCSLLLGNVLVNNTLTILLDTLTSGLVAVIGATMGIVVFGEIIPQAICSRHGLAVGAYTIWLTKFFMLLTFPLSFPISLILDKVLGQEMGTVYDKKKLMELLRVTDEENDIADDERGIVMGALTYTNKTVRDVMTKLEDVYMLPTDAILDYETICEIRDQGYSRIPVYGDNDRQNIVHILFAKDLMFVDPDDNTNVVTVCEFYPNIVNNVFDDCKLNTLFNDFKSGEKGHMAFVQVTNDTGDGDPFYETIGLVTLEDIIEEIIQQEITDEDDVIMDNKTKKTRKKKWTGGDKGLLALMGEEKKKVNISPQLNLAVFQYLSTSIEPFKVEHMNERVLKKLVTLDVFREIKLKKDMSKMSEDEQTIIYKGRPIDYFILIVEGRVEVNIGKEELVFESGPFTYFGIQCLQDVISESPSSPTLMNNTATRAATTPSSMSDVGGGGSSIFTNPKVAAQLRKASTQNPIPLDAAPVIPDDLQKRHHSIAAQETVLLPPGSRKGSAMVTSASMQSSAKQHHPPFVPDYNVKAVSDVIYLRIKRPMYCAALKASKMANNPKADGTENEHVLDRYLERVNEDEDNPDILVIGTPRAETRSLHTISRTGQTSKNGSAMRLADREEQEGEFWGESSRSTVRADSIGTEVRDVSRRAANAGSSSNGPASLPMGGNGDGGGGGGGGGGGSSTALLEKEGSAAVVAEGGGGAGEHAVEGGGQKGGTPEVTQK